MTLVIKTIYYREQGREVIVVITLHSVGSIPLILGRDVFEYNNKRKESMGLLLRK